MISQRPVEVAERVVAGHWEGDLIVGQGNKSYVGTLVERTTRLMVLLHLPNGPSDDQVIAALAAKLGRLPTELRRSVTWDQGIEMVNHTLFTRTTGVPVYFAEARSPWQRGSNENTNGLLRQYLPKGSDLRQHSATDLDAIAQALNDRPRQTLGWRTPSEVFNAVVAITAEAAVSPGGQFSAVVDRTKIYRRASGSTGSDRGAWGDPLVKSAAGRPAGNQPQHGRAGVGRARRQTGIAALSRKAPTKPSEVAAKKDSNHSIVCMICRVCVAEWRQPDGASGSMQQCPNGVTAARSVTTSTGVPLVIPMARWKTGGLP